MFRGHLTDDVPIREPRINTGDAQAPTRDLLSIRVVQVGVSGGQFINQFSRNAGAKSPGSRNDALETFADLIEQLFPVVSGRQCLFHRNRRKARRGVRL